MPTFTCLAILFGLGGFLFCCVGSSNSWLQGPITVRLMTSHTTFSTHGLDTSRLWWQKRYLTAYGIGSPPASFLGAGLGILGVHGMSIHYG